MNRIAVFFDRDDTVIKNVPYLGDPSGVELFPDAQNCLASLGQSGFLLFIVSNQSGVGRGMITPQQVDLVNAEMVRQLGSCFFSHVFSSFEEPGEPHSYCRKPSPHFLYQAAREYGIDLARSFFVGDRLADILAGRNAGCRTILVLSGHQLHERPLASKFADDIVDDLADVRRLILERTTGAQAIPVESISDGRPLSSRSQTEARLIAPSLTSCAS